MHLATPATQEIPADVAPVGMAAVVGMAQPMVGVARDIIMPPVLTRYIRAALERVGQVAIPVPQAIPEPPLQEYVKHFPVVRAETAAQAVLGIPVQTERRGRQDASMLAALLMEPEKAETAARAVAAAAQADTLVVGVAVPELSIQGRREAITPDAPEEAQVGIAVVVQAALPILICPGNPPMLHEQAEEVVAGLSKQQAEVAEEAEAALEIRAVPVIPVQQQTQLHLTAFL